MSEMIVTRAMVMAAEIERLRVKLECIAGSADNAAQHIAHIQHITCGTISERAVLENAIRRASRYPLTNIEEALRWQK